MLLNIIFKPPIQFLLTIYILIPILQAQFILKKMLLIGEIMYIGELDQFMMMEVWATGLILDIFL